VGEDPASQVYVRSKGTSTREAGMASFEHKLPAETSERDLLALIDKLNKQDDVDGILVQLPLPKHIDPGKVIEAIDPAKDVDGFHPINVGHLASGGPALVPCTPTGSLLLAHSVQPKLAGLNAVVIGRSNIVGKPMALLLLQQNCTVTIAHSRTKDLPEVVRRADLVVAAVGKAEMVKRDWIKPGAIVIDVGIQRATGPDGRQRLVGDVAFDEVKEVAGAITPVPGGVGPMTIACLLRNTLLAAKARRAR
jgi:methylenetetrahydrofolate dehydrogenase (NADP+)/methenyltetrahydrofolate cyclohydrolase